MYGGLRGGRSRSFGASSANMTAPGRRLTALKSSENLTTMVKQCRELFGPAARKSPPADRPSKGLKHPLLRSNLAGTVGIASLSWPCRSLGFWAMYRGIKSIKPYNAKVRFTAHLLKCIRWCQSRVWRVVVSLAIHTHGLCAFFCTKLASASASTSSRWISTSRVQETGWTWR